MNTPEKIAIRARKLTIEKRISDSTIECKQAYLDALSTVHSAAVDMLDYLSPDSPEDEKDKAYWMCDTLSAIRSETLSSVFVNEEDE